jgi:hypothetical protein
VADETEQERRDRHKVDGWIGVDLDGTLAEYHGWKGPELENIGAPVPLMLERVKRWLAEGRDVRIFTARASIQEQVPPVIDWCRTHLGRPLPVTCGKDLAMVELWDDRAIQVVPNVGLRADGKGEEAITSDLTEDQLGQLVLYAEALGGAAARGMDREAPMPEDPEDGAIAAVCRSAGAAALGLQTARSFTAEGRGLMDVIVSRVIARVNVACDKAAGKAVA